MTPIEKILKGLLMVSAEDVAKVLVVFGLVTYLMFAAVVIRQVGLMCRTLSDGRSFGLKLISWLHLGATVGILMLALVAL